MPGRPWSGHPGELLIAWPKEQDLIVFPEHALLIVEERPREQEAEGVRIPEGMPLEELVLRS
jgi:hypothetical protein